MQADILREKFLEFFKARKHKIVESDSLIPRDDPTVLFTPAGMNQFKKEFLGFDSGFKRAATSQRCLRTDDLDKVGKTSAHHTFFEMLGNFSFGDYFKKDAIVWAWEFLTKELKIKEDKLWVSVYEDDDEAYSIWLNEIKIPAKKIVKLGDKDNFWPAEAKTKGPNGPCGPCSEIFYDFGAEVGCGESICDPSCSCGRFVEIWNLVFTQFNRKEDGSLVPLPNKNIDTGMGLERLTAVMEGKQNNFETELFQPIIKEVIKGQSLPCRQAGLSGTVPTSESLYAVADHVRAITFSIYDGIIPANEGRGYVVRKIIRKSILHLRMLGINKPFMNKLVSLVAQIMRKSYPDLTDRQEDIARMILAEEEKFINTLNEAPRLLESTFASYNPANAVTETAKIELGRTVFKLYDTYGIPFELIKEWLHNKNIEFSQNEFDQALEEQKTRSKQGSNMKGDVFGVPKFAIENLLKTQFFGYDQFEIKAKVIRTLSECDCDDLVGVVLDKTVFYAEAGGQVSDIGTLSFEGKDFTVINVQKVDDVFVHWVKGGFPAFNGIVDAKIDMLHRINVARNHTATHILQAALRKVLGSHVQQQGSLVSADKLRFDFTHFKGLTKDELSNVEEVANSIIADKHSVAVNEMTLKEAKETKALAFFGEKYGEKVRVVSVGGVSKEFCGGTHIQNTADIGLIKIVQEGSVASGIRRIEAVTGEFAKQFIEDEKQRALAEADRMNKISQMKELEKQRGIEKDKYIQEQVPKAIEKSIKIDDINIIVSLEADLDMNALRRMVDLIKEKSRQAVIVLGSEDKATNKASLVIGITSDLLPMGLDAGALIREIAPIIGGSGGGRKDFAQAGGTKPDNFKLAFDKLKDIIGNKGR
jgi:alanyl-tRNA synthetase